jgi:hypothetical protein
MSSLPMIAKSVCVDPSWGKVMSVESKTAVIEHLGRQHQAMVALLADLVNIDSGSYNKRGVDAVGDRLAFLARPFQTRFLAIAWRRVSPASAATGRSC